MWGDASPATAESIAMQFELGDKGSATRLVASCAQGLGAFHFINHHGVVGRVLMSLLVLLLVVSVFVVGAVVEYLETAVLDQSRVRLLAQARR